MSMLLTLLAFQGAEQAADTGPRRTEPIAPLAGLFSDADYPVDAMARNSEGRVQVRLVIDPSGRVADCKIAQSSGDPGLDATTCAILSERARFHPGRNREGVPVIDTATTAISWRIGESMPPGISPFTAYRLAVSVASNERGEPECALDVNGMRERTPPGCPNLPPVIRDIARQLRAPASVVIVMAFTPQGGIIASPATPYGHLLAEAEADIVVDAQGQVADCRMVHRTVHLGGSPVPPDICAQPQRPRYLPGEANRRARVSIRLYLGRSVDG